MHSSLYKLLVPQWLLYTLYTITIDNNCGISIVTVKKQCNKKFWMYENKVTPFVGSTTAAVLAHGLSCDKLFIIFIQKKPMG